MTDKNKTEEIEEVSDSELEIQEEDFKPKPKKSFVMTEARKATLEKGRLKRLENINRIRLEKEELQRLKVDQIRGNYNAPPMDYTKLQSAPSGVNTGGTSGGWGIQRVN